MGCQGTGLFRVRKHRWRGGIRLFRPKSRVGIWHIFAPPMVGHTGAITICIVAGETKKIRISPLTAAPRCAIISLALKIASIAQSVEQLIRNQQVVCSSHIASSTPEALRYRASGDFLFSAAQCRPCGFLTLF